MKIDYRDDKWIIYLYQYKLTIDDTNELNREIKNIFIKLIKMYYIDFLGFYMVHIYENKKYGFILEIYKIYENDFNIIDLKLVIHKDVPFYLEMDDYLFDYKLNNLFVMNNKYYIDIKYLEKLVFYMEYGKLVYNSNFTNQNKKNKK